MTIEKNSDDSLLAQEVAARTQAEAKLQQYIETRSQEAAQLELAMKAFQLRHQAIEASANAMVVTSAAAPDFVIEYVNPAFERITGYSSEESIGRNCKFLQGDDRDQPGLDEIRAALREQREGNAILRNYRKDKSLLWNHLYVAPVRDQHGVVTHFVASQYDITPIKEYEARLVHQATHDELTGLPNRALLRDRLLQTIALSNRHADEVWVVFIDFDRFKVINDSFGYMAVDSFLKVVARRLREAMRESDTVARWGSDEFVIVMAEQTGSGAATAALQRLISKVTEAVAFHGQEFFLSCNMGIAVYPQDSDSPDTLLDYADIAAFHAKNDGPNHFRFHTADMNERAVKRLRTEADLRLAIEREEFVLHYQPQLDLVSGCVVGMEALIRWQHPERGLVYPLEFIGIAEETGLIVPIGDWVLRTACKQNKQWQDAGLSRMRVAVNLSARQFAQQNLVGTIATILAETGLAPGDLEIELTESMIMNDVEHVIGVLREIKALGMHISVDDFGTGYSSLAYLRRFPIDVLKIDRAFVMDIAEDDGDGAAIVNSIISLAHALKLRVIAEGVETIEQLNYLRRNGCDEMQGYYFSKPVAANAFADILRAGKRLEYGAA